MSLFNELYTDCIRDEAIEKTPLDIVCGAIDSRVRQNSVKSKRLSVKQSRKHIRQMCKMEVDLHSDGFTHIAGIDEAGRGPLAGPVVAAAVVLPEDEIMLYEKLAGLDDSKKLTAGLREYLFLNIIETAVAVGVGIATSREIDTLNILKATHLAMRRAVSDLKSEPDYVLIDGNSDPGMVHKRRCVIKGDSTALCISAASVVAKVSRDLIMENIDEKYQGYGFKKHKGYPTSEHYEALMALGPCPVHRRSYRLI